MSLIAISPRDCGRVRDLLDLYLDDELLVETIHTIVVHLERCRACKAALEGLERLRAGVRRAVRRERAPAALKKAILGAIRQE